MTHFLLYSLTDDQHRAYIISQPPGYSTYINAVFINVSYSKYFFLLVQSEIILILMTALFFISNPALFFLQYIIFYRLLQVCKLSGIYFMI